VWPWSAEICCTASRHKSFRGAFYRTSALSCRSSDETSNNPPGATVSNPTQYHSIHLACALLLLLLLLLLQYSLSPLSHPQTMKHNIMIVSAAQAKRGRTVGVCFHRLWGHTPTSIWTRTRTISVHQSVKTIYDTSCQLFGLGIVCFLYYSTGRTVLVLYLLVRSRVLLIMIMMMLMLMTTDSITATRTTRTSKVRVCMIHVPSMSSSKIPTEHYGMLPDRTTRVLQTAR
jgi:hypothetical protein